MKAKIIKCSDPLMWYNSAIGSEIDIRFSGNDILCKDHGGHNNIVLFKDIQVINEEWEIESVDRWYQTAGRNSLDYYEVTYWYDKISTERKEVVRNAFIFSGQEYSLPYWAKGITKKKRCSADDKMY